MKCVNRNIPKYKQMKELSGLSDVTLSAKISAWQTKNNTDAIPDFDQLGIVTESAYNKLNTLNFQYGTEVNLGDSVYYKYDEVPNLDEVNKSLPFGDKIVPRRRPNGDMYLTVRPANKTQASAHDALNAMYEKELGIPFDTFPLDTIDNEVAEQIVYFTELLDVDVLFDDKLTDSEGNVASGVVLSKNDSRVKDKPVIVLNPKALQSDTMAHEVSHLFIDMAGGLSNGRIRAAIQKLKDTNLYAELSKTLEGEKLDKELLTVALGREVSKLFGDEKQKTWWNRFVDWLFNLLSIKLNIPQNELRELAEQVYKGKMNLNVANLSSYDQFQSFDSSTISKEALTLNKILDKSSRHLEILLKRWKKENKTSQTIDFISAAERLNSEISEFIQLQNQAGLVNIVDYVYNQLTQIENELNNGELNSYYIGVITHFKNSLVLIEEVNNYVRGNRDELTQLTDVEIDNILAKIGEVLGRKTFIGKELKDKTLEVVAERLAKESNREENKFRILKEKEYLRDNPRGNMDKDEYNKAKFDYIQKEVDKNRDLIKQQQINFFTQQLSKGLDIGSAMFILDSGQVNSQVIQVVQKLLDRADMQTAASFINKRNEVKALYDEFVKEFGTDASAEALFSKFIVETEDGFYLRSRYLPEHHEIETSYRIRLNDLTNQGKIQEANDLSEEYEEWKKENNNKEGDNAVPTDKWLDPKFAKLSRKEKDFLSKIKDNFIKDDTSLFDNARLQPKYTRYEVFKLPQIEKTFAQRVFDNSLGNAVKRSFSDAVSVRASDIELNPEAVMEENKKINSIFKETYAKEDGTESNRIPVYFRRTVKKGDRSYDLFTLMLMNHWSSENFRNKFEVSADIELVADLISKKEYIKSQDGKMYLSKLLKNIKAPIADKLIKEPSASNEGFMLNSIMEHRLYGVGEISRMLGPNVSANKLANTINSYAASTMLMVNYFAAVPNFLMGQTMNIIEAGGRRLFDDENLKNAHDNYWRDAANFFNDIGSTKPTAKTTLLLDLFEVMNSVNSIKTKFIDDGSVRRFAKRDALYFLSHATEHYNQAVMMYAVLDNMEYNGKKLLDSIEAKDGQLLIDGVKLTKHHPAFEKMLTARQRIKKTIADNHGQYDERMKSYIQREWWGKTAFMLRKWLIRGMTRRFQGLGKPSIYGVDENINYDMVFYSNESEQFEEGNYVTALRFLNQLRKDVLKKQIDVMKNYNRLTDYEKENIRKTMRELIAFSLYFSAYLALNKMASDEGDDDMKNAYYMGAYFFRRTAGELMFYTNPGEFLNIMRTPAASLNFIEKVITTPFYGLEQYERSGPGYKKGDYKILKRLEDITPVYGQLFRYDQAEDILSFHVN